MTTPGEPDEPERRDAADPDDQHRDPDRPGDRLAELDELDGPGERHDRADLVAPPVMPTAAEAAGEERADPPPVLRTAFWVWVAAGAIGLIGAFYFFALRDVFVDAARKQDPTLDPVQVEQTAQGLSWFLIVGSVVFLAFFVLLAHKARAGVRKARALLLVVGVLGAGFNYAFRLTVFQLLSALLIIVGAGLLFLPSVSRYFRHRAS